MSEKRIEFGEILNRMKEFSPAVSHEQGTPAFELLIRVWNILVACFPEQFEPRAVRMTGKDGNMTRAEWTPNPYTAEGAKYIADQEKERAEALASQQLQAKRKKVDKLTETLELANESVTVELEQAQAELRQAESEAGNITASQAPGPRANTRPRAKAAQA